MIAVSVGTRTTRAGGRTTHLDRVAVWQLELLHTPLRLLLFLGRVERDVAALFLNRPHDLTLCRGVQMVTRFPQ